jgi:hypothetical protein
MILYILAALLGLGIGVLIGLSVGIRAFQSQRQQFAFELQGVSNTVVELSRQSHDGRIPPEVVLGWLSALRMKFAPFWV